jgi:peptidoglycan hydrolase FlgJ
MNIHESSMPLPKGDARAALMTKARELETAFLSEMLAHSGLDASPDGFGGGAGEDQFSSFLRDEQAKLLVRRGGIGLAETLFKALLKVQGGRDGL